MRWDTTDKQVTITLDRLLSQSRKKWPHVLYPPHKLFSSWMLSGRDTNICLMVVKLPLLYWKHMAYLFYRGWLLRVTLALERTMEAMDFWIFAVLRLLTWWGCLTSDLHLAFAFGGGHKPREARDRMLGFECRLPCSVWIHGLQLVLVFLEAMGIWGQESWSRSFEAGLEDYNPFSLQLKISASWFTTVWETVTIRSLP